MKGPAKRKAAPLSEWTNPSVGGGVFGIDVSDWRGCSIPDPDALDHNGPARGFQTWAKVVLMRFAASSAVRYESDYVEGFARDEGATSLIAALTASGGTLLCGERPEGVPFQRERAADGHVTKRRKSDEEDEEAETHGERLEVALGGPHALVLIEVTTKSWRVRVEVIALGDLARRIWGVVCEHVKIQVEKTGVTAPRPVYFFASGQEGPGLVPVGGVTQGLCRDNYPSSVLVDYDRAVANIMATHPNGRLVILSGPTGTGKTHLIHGMIHAAPRAIFVMIDPDILANLTKPGMLPVLLATRERHPSAPIVFIVEDGDASIARRGLDNLAHLHVLLNLGGGLAGDMLNVHVIVSTNAGVGTGELDIDKAVKRRRRLAAHIQVEPLPRAHALRVFERLAPDQDARYYFAQVGAPSDATVPLSTIYDAATLAGWKDDTPRASAVGRRIRRKRH